MSQMSYGLLLGSSLTSRCVGIAVFELAQDARLAYGIWADTLHLQTIKPKMPLSNLPFWSRFPTSL